MGIRFAALSAAIAASALFAAGATAQNAPSPGFGATGSGSTARPATPAQSAPAPAAPTASPAPAAPGSPPAPGAPTAQGAPGAAAGQMKEIPPEQRKVLEQFNTYRRSEDHKKLAQSAVREGEIRRRGTCKTVTVKEGRMVDALGLKFTDKPFPVAGQWREQWLIDRCGTEVIHNILFSARPAALPVFVVFQPGDTALPPNLQERVSNLVISEAAAKVPNCAKTLMRLDGTASAIVMNTKYGETLNPGTKDAKGVVVGSKWNENWTVLACGQTKQVKIGFSISNDAKVASVVEQVN